MKPTQSAWEEYYADLAAFEARMEMVKPKKEEYDDEKAFDKAMNEWFMSLHCDAPNSPDSEFSNND